MAPWYWWLARAADRPRSTGHSPFHCNLNLHKKALPRRLSFTSRKFPPSPSLQTTKRSLNTNCTAHLLHHLGFLPNPRVKPLAHIDSKRKLKSNNSVHHGRPQNPCDVRRWRRSSQTLGQRHHAAALCSPSPEQQTPQGLGGRGVFSDPNTSSKEQRYSHPL